MDNVLGCQEGLPGPCSSKDPLPSCTITGFGSGRTLPAMAGMQGVWEALREGLGWLPKATGIFPFTWEGLSF